MTSHDSPNHDQNHDQHDADREETDRLAANAPHADHPSGGEHDPSLASTVASLRALSVSLRDEPADDFESRIAHATMPGVAARIGHPEASLDSKAQTSTGWVGRSWWMLPVAAALAVGVFMTQRVPTDPEAVPRMTLASVEADLEDFLFIDELVNEQSASYDTAEDFGAADTLNDGADSESSAHEIFFELFAEQGESL